MRGSSIVLAGLLLASAALCARAEVEVEVRNGDKVTGTLSPADEVETLSVRLPAGALLTAVAKGKKTKGSKVAPVVTLQVLDEADADLSAGLVVQKGTGAAVKKLEVAATGLYRVRVRGTTTTPGSYLLKIKWKSPKKVVRELDLSTGTATVDFAADASALVSFKLKGAKKSTTLPRLERVDALPGGGDPVHLFVAPTDPTATSQKAKKVRHPRTASYRVTVNDVSGLGDGAAKLTIAIKAPKVKKLSVDVSDKKIGAGPSGGGSVKGVVVDETGGVILIPPGDLSGIGGAGLTIPAGALPGSTPMLVGTAPPFQSSLLPDQSPAGPTVFFGPDGQQFASEVTVTIPFVAASFDGDFTTLRVVQVEADGTETVVDVTDYTINELDGTVSFPSLHFTAFRVFGPPVELVLGDLDGDGEAEFLVPSINSLGGEGSIALFDMLPNGEYTYASIADARLQGSSLAAGTTGRFGTSFASHDVSGDGVADLVVGAPASDDGGLLIFLGGAQQGPVVEEDFALRGATREGFGQSVALGDFDGDRLIDIAGGGTGADDAGRLHVFLGSGGLRTIDTDRSDREIVGQLAGSRFAHALAVGDVTGDGLDDLIVPTPRIDSQAGGGGIVQIYAGSSQVNGGLSASPVATLQAVVVASEFGSAVDVGDVNGDGTLDVIVGASNSAVTELRPGSVFVFFGGPGLGDATAAEADVTLHGLVDREEFGFAIRVLDFDGDGTDDIAVGSPNLDISVPSQLDAAGLAVLFYGSSTLADGTRADADATLSPPPAENGRTGVRFLPAFDYDGDGTDDLGVFAPGVMDQDVNGLVAVYRGDLSRQAGELLPSVLHLGEPGTFPVD